MSVIKCSSNQYTTPPTHHLCVGLKLTTLLHHSSLHTDQTILTPKILIGKPDIIEKKRLQWYGHVKRMPEERIPKLIMEWIPQERRKRGCPRKTWMEGVQAAMTRRNLEQDQWRNRGMAFCFQKTVTAIKNTGYIDINNYSF
jgi:hypothetical protein